MSNQLISKLENVKTRADLSEFVSALLNDLEGNNAEWENASLSDFLEAMSSWIEDMDGYYKNQGKPFSEDQPWKLFADILYASKIYE
ncbi:MAG: hypothetical protein CSA49_06830 [Gammaproteobacteria bacterium]|nr:MAG: hypothetical protein CSA49_06830 [Gammaproteobacteria bacterium]